MNTPTRPFLDSILSVIGSSSTLLGNGSIGLISAQFSASPNLTISQIQEATFHGYSRKALGTSTVTFSGGDGKEYVELATVQFIPSDTVSPNTIYGAFLTSGSGTVTLQSSDPFPNPLPMSGPQNQITITVRYGLDPLGNFGLEIISN